VSDLKPDRRLIVGPAANFATLMKLLAKQPFQEFTLAGLVDETGMSTKQVRGLLHAGWSVSWIRPVLDHTGTKAERWQLDPAFAHWSDRYRESIAQRAQLFRADFDRFLQGPELAPLGGGLASCEAGQ